MALKIKKKIKASPQTVFEAITTQKGYQGWWTSTCDIDCSIGKLSKLRFEKTGITEEMHFEALESSPLQKLIWKCTYNNVFETWLDSLITFEIWEHQNSCTLTLSQNSPTKSWNKTMEFNNSKAGWNYFLDSLKDYCETGLGVPWE